MRPIPYTLNFRNWIQFFFHIILLMNVQDGLPILADLSVMRYLPLRKTSVPVEISQAMN